MQDAVGQSHSRAIALVDLQKTGVKWTLMAKMHLQKFEYFLKPFFLLKP